MTARPVTPAQELARLRSRVEMLVRSWRRRADGIVREQRTLNRRAIARANQDEYRQRILAQRMLALVARQDELRAALGKLESLVAWSRGRRAGRTT